MFVIRKNSTDPWFNIASDEYILEHFHEDTFSLWRSESSVIVGKHQNSLAEINHSYVTANNIPVIRRISGGGTVYHDRGNINFTFTRTVSGNDFINYRKYTRPVIDALKKTGIKARFEGKSDLTVSGKKISGNSMHVRKNKLLHHGTLLYSTDLEVLATALDPGNRSFSGIAVASVRRPVANISSFLSNPPDISEFTSLIGDFLTGSFSRVRFYELTAEDRKNIEELVEKKYKTWDWTYGYSPAYSIRRHIRCAEGEMLEWEMDVRNGIIIDVRITIGGILSLPSDRLKNCLIGIPHRHDLLRKALENSEIRSIFTPLIIDEFVENCF